MSLVVPTAEPVIPTAEPIATLNVVAPSGVKTGQTFSVVAPNGESLSVPTPPEVAPGLVFPVIVPARFLQPPQQVTVTTVTHVTHVTNIYMAPTVTAVQGQPVGIASAVDVAKLYLHHYRDAASWRSTSRVQRNYASGTVTSNECLSLCANRRFQAHSWRSLGAAALAQDLWLHYDYRDGPATAVVRTEPAAVHDPGMCAYQ